MRIRLNCSLALYAATLLLLSTLSSTAARSTRERQIVNEWELHSELKVTAGSESAVKDYFPSFLEYQDLVMFHHVFGYYSSGRVDFTRDYRTYPIVLAPNFGQMAAEQIFRMWRGMRQAGTLGAGEQFTIAEFGAGDGTLAESILDYLDQKKAKATPNEQWREFAQQTLYVCYDRSHALSQKQKARNARFGKRFDAREADATDPVRTIGEGSLKGVFLSNELPDAFSVHKVILSVDGEAEVAYVAPSLSQQSWDGFKKRLPEAVIETVETGDRAIEQTFFSGEAIPGIYLSRTAFATLLETLAASESYEEAPYALIFEEIYIPVDNIPELASHLRRYANLYAGVLAKNERGIVTYINLGVEKLLQGASRILSAGYVMTLDYGANWEGILAKDSYPHLRTFGPSSQSNYYDDYYFYYTGETVETTYDPYMGPTLHDLTTDVNFSLMAAEGELAGLKTIYYGPQRALQTGTPIELDLPPEYLRSQGVTSSEFKEWASSFKTDYNYRLMLQQKANTDSEYVYPDEKSDPLGLDQDGLSEAQKTKAAEIAKRLIESAK